MTSFSEQFSIPNQSSFGGMSTDLSQFMGDNQNMGMGSTTQVNPTMFGQGGFANSNQWSVPTGVPTPTPVNQQWSWLGGTNKDGSKINSGLGMGISALQAGAGLYFGKQQADLAQDQFAEAKSQFSKSFGSSVKEYNTNISDRQDRRYSGAGGDANANNPYQKTDAYMAENKMVA